MVHLEAVQASNRSIASIFGPGLIAVFVGGTSGIGETTLKIKAECKALNSDGEYIFIKKDTSLLRNVDLVCDEIKSKEKSINLLFLTVGTLQTGIKTEEGLHYAAGLVLYCRHRFISNLLPLIQVAPGLRRVVTTFVAIMEGTILKDDFQLWNRNLMRYRGHAASVVSLALEKHAKDAPEVSFIHNFPGGIARGTGWILGSVLRGVYGLFGSLVHMPFADAGDRHVFLATSARYPASGMEDQVDGVPIADGDQVAKGTDGRLDSGLYSIDMFGESAKPEVYEVLEKYRKEGMVDWV
ncbi:Oxidoreductase andH [Lachnellula arida]|uniref:Oxidoreductase andH n=1 Tax=Lachnellula arida TaxID=1316785 RepID=A0A8T9B7Z0_9HELO|nr:Oxidoreductase andH [Lachnellula arida]